MKNIGNLAKLIRVLHFLESQKGKFGDINSDDFTKTPLGFILNEAAIFSLSESMSAELVESTCAKFFTNDATFLNLITFLHEVKTEGACFLLTKALKGLTIRLITKD